MLPFFFLNHYKISTFYPLTLISTDLDVRVTKWHGHAINKQVTRAWKNVLNTGNITMLSHSSIHIIRLVHVLKLRIFYALTTCNMPFFCTFFIRFLNTVIIYLIYKLTNHCTVTMFISSCCFASLCVITMKSLHFTQAQELRVNYVTNALQKCIWSVWSLLTFNTCIWSKEIILYSVPDALQNQVSLMSDFTAQKL